MEIPRKPTFPDHGMHTLIQSCQENNCQVLKISLRWSVPCINWNLHRIETS